MPLVFHEVGASANYKKIGTTIPLLLKEGLKSQSLLRQEGKLPLLDNPYEKALKRRREWRIEREYLKIIRHC